MYNEIRRKITSLTLMTIMLAGGMTIAAPGMVPEAFAANANLFVSAENSQFDNYMSGPQVIEVVVIDSDINDTDEAKGEPDVTVNGKILRMVQGVDGNWYGYFADRNMAQNADATVDPENAGTGLDFGTLCTANSAWAAISQDAAEPVVFSDSDGVAIPKTVSGSTGVDPLLNCNNNDGGNVTPTLMGDIINNVVRESKAVNETEGPGQIGVNPDAWPFIQLYQLNPTGNVIIQYNKGGGAQSTTLTFDTVDNYAGVELDRTKYPRNAQVHATVTDLWLNIDPTDEDSWTFATNADDKLDTFYQVFDENGGTGLTDDVQSQPQSLAADLRSLMCEDNCILIIDTNVQDTGNGVLTIQDNDDSIIESYYGNYDYDATRYVALRAHSVNAPASVDALNATALTGLALNTVPVTITEQGPNSGVFGTYDESDKSVLRITEDARRGVSASIDYNETPITILVGHDFANIDIKVSDDEWNSGEEVPVVIIDGDANTNSRVDEDLDLNDPDVLLIPSLATGNPFTLGASGQENLEVAIYNDITSNIVAEDAVGTSFIFSPPTSHLFPTSSMNVEGFSDRGVIQNVAANITPEKSILIDLETTLGDLQNTINFNSTETRFTGFNLFNYDIRSLNTDGKSINILLVIEKDEIITKVDFDDSFVDFDKDAEIDIDDNEVIEFADADGDGIKDLNESFLAFIDVNENGQYDGNESLLLSNYVVGFNGFRDDTVSTTTMVNKTSETVFVTALNPLANLTGVKLIQTVDEQGYVSISNPDPSTDIHALYDLEQILKLDNTNDNLGLIFQYTSDVSLANDRYPIVADFFSFGFKNDGLIASDRIANQIIRIEAEESGDNTSTFEGTLEYIMINQLNVNDIDTYTGISTIADDPSFIVMEDLTDEDSPRVNYLDLGSDGVSTQVADQQEAPSHSGVVSLDADSYKNADTVTITLDDLDLNVDSDLIDIYTVVTFSNSTYTDPNIDVVGDKNIVIGGTSFELSNRNQLGRLLDVTFDDELWTSNNNAYCTQELRDSGIDTGLAATGFSLIETGIASGKFVGDFQIPKSFCRAEGEKVNEPKPVSGLDIEVNYVDFRDASGEIIEVGDSSGVRAHTGSVSLDRTVYPVPFGVPGDYTNNDESTPTSGNTDRSVFPIHQTGTNGDGIDIEDRDNDGLTSGEFLDAGDLTIHVRVNDPDFDVSASGEDTISESGVGPVRISVIRGSDTVTLGYAGGDSAIDGVIDVGNDGVQKLYRDSVVIVNDDGDLADRKDPVNDKYYYADLFKIDPSNVASTIPADVLIRTFGPINEIAPDAGIFEADIIVKYTDGPASPKCPDTDNFKEIVGSRSYIVGDYITPSELERFDVISGNGMNYCILQGDILQVEYTDPADASGDKNTVTDSATFDLRNGVLQSDKSVYIIGSDMILTLIEPDLDLDNDQRETYDLDLIEWDSDAATISMGDADSEGAAFDPEPLDFRETGDSTGIFQIVIEIPEALDDDYLERGEEIILEYTDWGPSGSDYVGDEDEDVNLTIFTSNFGATVELDQKVYSWTDKVYITVVAPDHNFDGDLVDEIGNSERDPLKVSTRGFDLDEYKLVETGTDTGIFTGEVILTGFGHDADGDEEFDTNPRTMGEGPTDGFLQTDDDDGLTVSFEFSEDETVVGSSLIRWNIGEVQWLEASYPASGTGVVRVIDPDMNLDPEAVDNFDVDVWSDSDAGGIDLTVTETNEATGIYEGTVFFTTTEESSGHRLRVAEGDTVTAEYEDNTLPDPYTTADELDITATSLIGTVVPPLEKAPASNLRTVDAFGNSIDTVAVDQQVQITADLKNGQDKEQTFAYLVQVQDANGVTVSLSWITGSLSSGQSFSPALSWIPTSAGAYTATVFVWESVDNPTALSPPVSTTISVN